jgi:drug/metabolite transporter (DMT)-like permease
MLMILSISVMTVVIRRHRDTSMVAAASVSNFLGSLVSIPFAQGIAAVTPADLGILAMFGLFQVGLGLTFFTIGSRHLPAAQSSLIGMVETPLMAFWVYLGFGEIPSLRALIGGALVMGAVIADILADSRAHAGDAAAKAVTSGE